MAKRKNLPEIQVAISSGSFSRSTACDASQIDNGVIGKPTGDRMTAGGRKSSMNFPDLVEPRSVRSVNASQNRPGYPSRYSPYTPDWDVNDDNEGQGN